MALNIGRSTRIWRGRPDTGFGEGISAFNRKILENAVAADSLTLLSFPQRKLAAAADERQPPSSDIRGRLVAPFLMSAKNVRNFILLALAVPLAGLCGGCTSFLLQQQGKHWTGHYPDCPRYFCSTRLEAASLEWAFSGDQQPPDACLAHYYRKAGKDSFYQDFNRAMAPLYLLSLPVDLMLDTITLPLAAAAAP